MQVFVLLMNQAILASVVRPRSAVARIRETRTSGVGLGKEVGLLRRERESRIGASRCETCG
jgi:hypothetical protein